MPQLKVNYGIDLGTTNSAITRMEGGRPVVKKVEVTDDTMPSCVYFPKNKVVRVGNSAYNGMTNDKRRAMKKMDAGASNAFVEFKRTMGTDQRYVSANMDGRAYSSEELSAEVLKALKSYIADEPDLRAAVITVPAKFNANQKTATIKAARLAGFEHVELLQEPIAAAMAYGLTAAQKDGYWLVFDFGGGTFDAALIKVEDGIIQVFDTEGDNYLGGKNLDYAIVDDILIPFLQANYSVAGILADQAKKNIVREAMKTYAEEIKNALSFNETYNLYVDPGDLGEDEDGEEYEIDMDINREMVNAVMRPHFQKAVDICNDLLARNNLTGAQLGKLILVGGPTHSPLLRRMLRLQVSQEVDTSVNPMTAVAEGAALYASTIDNEISDRDLDRQDVVLDIKFESMTVDTDLWVPVTLKSGPEAVNVQFVRHDNAWDSGRIEVTPSGNIVELNLLEGTANTFGIECFDTRGNRLKCFPAEITIIQGSKVGSATLPYDISLAIFNDVKKRDVIKPIAGLERNKTVPATGTVNGLHTNVQVRVGVETDVLRIPLYQADHGGAGKTATLYEFVGEVEINGDDVDVTIPKGAPADITVKVDRNEQMTVSAYFPGQDITVEKAIDTSKEQPLDQAREFVNRELPNARDSIKRLEDEGYEVADLKDALRAVEQEQRNSNEDKMVMQHLKELLRRIETLEESTGAERAEKELRRRLEMVKNKNEEVKDPKATQHLKTLQPIIDEAIRRKDEKLMHDLTEDLRHLYVELTLAIQCRWVLEDMNRVFATLKWRDPARARELVNKGLAAAANNADKEELRSIVLALYDLLPSEDKNRFGSGLS